MNIFHITPDFNYACGRSYYVYLLMKYQSKAGNNVALITNKGDSLDRLEKLGLRYFLLTDFFSKNPFLYNKNKSKLKNIFEQFNADIIHTHHRFAELTAVRAVKSLGRKKIKTVFTALSIVEKKYGIEYRSDKIIAVSNSVKQMLSEKFNVDENKIILINNFTDTDELDFNHYDDLTLRTGKPGNGTFNILSVGRFDYEKNYETLLEAVRLFDQKLIKTVMVGEGRKYKNFKKFAEKNRLNVEFVKPLSNLHKYFYESDMCVLTSVRDPFPSFMLQSGLHSKPFVGSSVDGIAELIRDGQNGILFRPGNARELAEKISQLREDKTLAALCATNLHNDVIKNFTQKSIIPKIEKLYSELIN